MLCEETFAISIALINGILYDKHKILENSELDVYYEIIKDEVKDDILFIESIKAFIKQWPSSYKRPSPFEIIDFYKNFLKEKKKEEEINKQIELIKKMNQNLIAEKQR